MENIIENNKIIAEFMGYPKYKINFIGKRLNFENSKHNTYHKDWNWLMKVVEKIESLEDNLKNETKEDFKQFQKILSLPVYTKIEVVYNSCVNFIKWYNENK